DEIARDIGRPADPRRDAADPVDVTRLSRDVGFRLSMQWPHQDVGAVDVAVAEAAAEAESLKSDAFTAAVLSRLGLETSAYDVTEDVMRDGIADAAPSGPPPPPVIEMGPYVPLRHWRAPTRDELRHCPLVIATPRNSFRIQWLRGLFSDCRVRVIHLTRNPAASVNGLLDGWQDDGFFTTPMSEGLRIDGYSDVHPWGDRWWKFDVPPLWRHFVRAPLAAVAAEQWRAAHLAIVEDAGSDDLRVRYEDVVGSPEQRASAGRAMAQFLSIDENETVAAVVAGTRPVMATAPPARRRWSGSGHDLAPALAEPAVWEMAVELGYDVDERLWI
ncbi:MAG TPA: hypothetical protein VKJ07_12730, partial [Mycobacteriales bacterium]|nr:hypothetical protein [Mycobacteriales bacterium]